MISSWRRQTQLSHGQLRRYPRAAESSKNNLFIIIIIVIIIIIIIYYYLLLFIIIYYYLLLFITEYTALFWESGPCLMHHGVAG